MELDVSASEAGPQSKKRRFMPNLADLPKYCSLQDLEVFESATQWDTIGVFYDGQGWFLKISICIEMRNLAIGLLILGS